MNSSTTNASRKHFFSLSTHTLVKLLVEGTIHDALIIRLLKRRGISNEEIFRRMALFLKDHKHLLVKELPEPRKPVGQFAVILSALILFLLVVLVVAAELTAPRLLVEEIEYPLLTLSIFMVVDTVAIISAVSIVRYWRLNSCGPWPRAGCKPPKHFRVNYLGFMLGLIFFLCSGLVCLLAWLFFQVPLLWLGLLLGSIGLIMTIGRFYTACVFYMAVTGGRNYFPRK